MASFDEVGDRVFRRRYDSLDLNIGVVIGEAGAAVIDTRASHEEAEQLKAELAGLTRAPVIAVINTHYHWDHVWGNAQFPKLPIWGHVRCAEFLKSSGEEMRGEVLKSLPPEQHRPIRDVVTTPPTDTFAAVARIGLGDRDLWLSYHGRAHTDSDIVIRVVDAGVIFMGDLIEEGAPPQFGSSYPVDWPATLAAIEPDVAPTVVPGHGDVVGSEFVRGQREELAAVADALVTHPAGSERPPAGPYPRETMAQAWFRYREYLTDSTA